jgi:hypothetical protein
MIPKPTKTVKVKKKHKKSDRQKLQKECNSLWSKCVIVRDRVCRYSNSDYRLSAHHIRSCSNANTEYDLENGITLAWSVHCLQKFQPEKFQDMVLEIIGQEKYNYLKAKSLIPRKWTVEDLMDKKEELKLKLEELKKE